MIEYVFHRLVEFSHFTQSLQAGLILCCLGFAIFGISEVPTDGVEFDTGDFGGESNTDSVAAPSGTNYNPPTSTAEESSTEHEPDPEKGEGNMGSEPQANTPSTSVTQDQPPTTPAPKPIDLLDDCETGKQTADASINELD